MKFKSARGNLLLVALFSAINLLLIASDANFYMLFSASVPLYIFAVFRELGLASIGLAAALVGVGIYFLFWVLSKRNRVFMLVAMILFALDTLLLLGISFYGNFEFSSLLDIAVHAWVLFYLITGTAAWAKLKNVTPEEEAAAMQPAAVPLSQTALPAAEVGSSKIIEEPGKVQNAAEPVVEGSEICTEEITH